MPSSRPTEDKEYDDLRIAYELGTLMRSSDVKVTEIDAKEGRKFTRFGRAYVRYTFNQLKEVTVHVLAVAFSTSVDVIINIINNNYNRKKIKNGDDILEDDEIRMEDLELLVSLEDWIARRRYDTRIKEEGEEDEEKRYMPTPPPGLSGIPLPMEPTPAGGAPLPSPASSAAAAHTKKKKSRRSKKQNKASNVQADAESKEKDEGNEDKSASKKRTHRDAGLSEERGQERRAKVKKVASTAGPATSSVSDVQQTAVSSSSTATTVSSSKAKNSKHVPAASSFTTITSVHKKAETSSLKKAKTPANIQTDVPQPFSDKESLKLMDNFFKDAGPYMPDYLDQLLVDKFGPQELSYLKRQCVTKEKMMEELKDVDIKIFRGRPVRLSTFTDAVVKAKEAAWKTLEKELEKGLCSMR